MNFSEPYRIKKLLSDYEGMWMIAGGWAIDLYLNRNTREHHDIEIAIPRIEQLQLRDYLKDWNLKYVISGKFYDWDNGNHLELPIHGKSDSGEKIEILLNEIENETWCFRRNLKIRYALSRLIVKSKLGIPILSPEIVLLYKAKSKEGKDYSDLENILPLLDRERKKWLKESILLNHGQHEWVDLI